jgi:hypothetical protein
MPSPVPLSLLLLVSLAAPALAQQDSHTIVLLRTATGRGTYHYAEVIHERGRLVPFDVGYIDFDNPSEYREMWIGGGAMVFRTPVVSLLAEGFLARAFGEQSGDALYFQPFFLTTYRLAPRLGGEAVYFPYIPLNDAARAQHLLERVKLEYDFARFKIGGGYGAYRWADHAWHHKPFVTATLKAGPVGNVELWVQRLQGDHVAVQLRYARVFSR